MSSFCRRSQARFFGTAFFLVLWGFLMEEGVRGQSLEQALDIEGTGILLLNDPEFPWTVTTDVSSLGDSGAQSAALRGFDGTSQLQAFMPGPGTLTFAIRSISGNQNLSGFPEEQIAMQHNGRLVATDFRLDLRGAAYALLGTDRLWKRVTLVFDEPGGYVFWEHGGIQNGGLNLSSNRVSVSWLDDLHWRPTQPELSLAEALDVPTLSWSTDPSNPWIGNNWQAAPVSDREDYDAAMSPGAASWIETTVDGPGQLSFWWRSGANGGVALEIDGEEMARYDDLDLAWRSERIPLGSGSHTLRWRSDGAPSFLDAVTIEPAREDIDLDVALDIPGVKVRKSGTWVGQSAVIHANSDAVRGGNVNSGKNAWIEIEAPTPGTLRFDWRLDSLDPGDTFSFSNRIFGNWLDLPFQAPRDAWGSPGDVSFAEDFGRIKLRWTYRRGSLAGREGNAYLDNIVYTDPDGTVLWPSDEGGPNEGELGGSETLAEALDIDGSALVLRTGGAQPWTIERGSARIAGPDSVASPDGLKAGESGWLEIETPGPGILYYWASYWQTQRPVLGPHRTLPTIYPSVSINGEGTTQGFLSTQWRMELFAHRLDQLGSNTVRWTIEEGAETLDFEDNFLFLDHVTFVPAGEQTGLAGALDAPELNWATSSNPGWEVALVGADAMREPYRAYGRDAADVNLYGAVSRAALPGERAWLETELQGPGVLGFDLSASGDHPLELRINGSLVATYGEGAHSPESHRVFLPEGRNTVRWEAAPTRAQEPRVDFFQSTSLDRIRFEPGPDVATVFATNGGWLSSDGQAPWTLETDSSSGTSELRAGSWLGLDVEGPGLLTYEWRVPASVEQTEPLGDEPELWLTDRGVDETFDDAWRRVIWRDRSGRPFTENPDDFLLGLGNPQDYLPEYEGDGQWVQEQIILGSGAHDLRWQFQRNAAGLQKRELDLLEDRQGRVRHARFDPGIPVLIDDPSGLVRVSPEQTTFSEGTEIQLQAGSNEEWRFIRWSRDLASTDPSLSLTVAEPMILRANYGTPVDTAGIAPAYLEFASEIPTGVFGQPFVDGPQWERVSGEGVEAGDAIKVGPALDFVEGQLVTFVEGPAVVRFQARLLKETLTGSLTVRVGDQVAATIEEGDGQWRRYEAVVPEGEHPVTWAYTMHFSEAWLDDIQVLDPDQVPLPGLRLLGPQRVSVAVGDALDLPLEVQGDPILFDVLSVPPGLSVDPKSGRIAGLLSEAGSYRVALLASNATAAEPIFVDIMALDAAPQFHGIQLDNGALRAGLDIDPRFHYQLYASEDLVEWRAFGDPITREGVSALRLPLADGGQRYFRIAPVPNSSGASARLVSKGERERWLVLHSDLGRGATLSLVQDDTGVERVGEILWRDVDDRPLRLRFNAEEELESLTFEGRTLLITEGPGAALGFQIVADGIVIAQGGLPSALRPSLPASPSPGGGRRRWVPYQEDEEERDVVDSFFRKLFFVDKVKGLIETVKQQVNEAEVAWGEQVDAVVGVFDEFVDWFSESDSEWVVESTSPEPAIGYELARPVEVEELGVPVGFEERSLLEMEAKRAKARAGGVSFSVTVVDTDLDPFADYRDPEDRPNLIVFGDSEEYIRVRVITNRGHDVTMTGDSTPTFENLDLRDGDVVFVLGSFRGRPMEAVDGWSRIVKTQDNGVRYLSGERPILKLQKTESWKRALHGRHWAVERPTYWKPWSSRNLSLCVDSRPNRRWPDLWSEGNHPQARREYFILSQGPWTVLARDPYNCRCEFLGTPDLDDSIRWRLNFVIQDEGDFSHYSDRVNVTDLITGDTFEWRGWSSGTSPSQPNVPCL